MDQECLAPNYHLSTSTHLSSRHHRGRGINMREGESGLNRAWLPKLWNRDIERSFLMKIMLKPRLDGDIMNVDAEVLKPSIMRGEILVSASAWDETKSAWVSLMELPVADE